MKKLVCLCLVMSILIGMFSTTLTVSAASTNGWKLVDSESGTYNGTKYEIQVFQKTRTAKSILTGFKKKLIFRK